MLKVCFKQDGPLTKITNHTIKILQQSVQPTNHIRSVLITRKLDFLKKLTMFGNTYMPYNSQFINILGPSQKYEYNPQAFIYITVVDIPRPKAIILI